MLNYPVFTTGARPHFGFPFWLGSVADAISVISIPTVTRWTTVGSAKEPWRSSAVGLHRFERVYARPATGFGQSVNFNYEIRSQFPLILSSNQQAVITSTITNP